jgi:hypothetical protein
MVHEPRTSAAASGLTSESKTGRWRIRRRVMAAVSQVRLAMVEDE